MDISKYIMLFIVKSTVFIYKVFKMFFCMLKLITNEGKWALKDNSMIFSNIVWLVDEKDANLYHLIDDNHKEIKTDKKIIEYIVDC